MVIAVTGSSGLIGSNLVRVLRERGHDVHGLDLVTGCNLSDAGDVENMLKTIKPEVVFHLAANASEAVGQDSPVDMTQNNIGIFSNTLKASINAGVKKFIYTSSVAVYGEANVPYKEDGPTIPKDVYGINKLACEQILKVMAKVHNFSYTIFRPHNVYGPGQNMGDVSKNVVALFMRRILENKPLTLFGEGKMRRAFSYVDDVVGVLAESVTDFDNITMNVGSSQDISIKELSDLIQELSGLRAQVEVLPARKQEITMFLADHTTQDRLANYQETTIRDGLRKTWDWVTSQALPTAIIKNKEIYVHA